MSTALESSVSFSSFEESITRQPTLTAHHGFEFAFHRFSLLREKTILTDAAILSSDGKRFDVHSVVMAGTTDYFFNNLLNCDNHPTSTQFPPFDNSCQLTIPSESVEMIITFCYTNSIDIAVDNVANIFAGAQELRIQSLIPLCCDVLEESLNISNCIQLLEIADKHDLGALRENALAIISDVLPHVSKLPEFFNLSSKQIKLVLEQLSSQDEIFTNLLNSVYEYEMEHSFVALTSEMQSVFLAAFVTGFLMRHGSPMRNIVEPPPQVHTQNSEPNEVKIADVTCETQAECESAKVSASADEDEYNDEQQSHHVLCLLKRRTFNTFWQIDRKWENSSAMVDLTHSIDSFRDAIMIPIDQQVVIFRMKSGSIAHAELLTLETNTLEKIPLPTDVECANLTLFCQLNRQIYCFARSDQQYFHGFDFENRKWSAGYIEDVMDAKYIVGLKHELFFLGCGYNRTMVRSYHISQGKWTVRGNLRHEHKETCFKAVPLNGSIYVVMSRFDSEKIYNGTEFLIQRYDDNVEDWVIIKRIYYTYFLDSFNLEVAGNRLYLFYGDGMLQVYDEDEDKWQKGPSIDFNVLDVAMCMVAVKQKRNGMQPT